MKQNGWIKLHRKMLINDELFRASSTFPVLCLLLLLANEKGKVTTSRNSLASRLRLNPNTLYSALKRLEVQQVIQQQTNNKSTTITILNWSLYQSKQDDTNKAVNSTLREVQQQTNSPIYIQEYKNKEERDTSVSRPSKELHKTREYLTHIPEQELTELTTTYKASTLEVKNKAEDLHNWALSKGRIYKDYRAFLRNALAKDYGKRETDSFHGIPILRSSNYAKPN